MLDEQRGSFYMSSVGCWLHNPVVGLMLKGITDQICSFIVDIISVTHINVIFSSPSFIHSFIHSSFTQVSIGAAYA